MAPFFYGVPGMARSAVKGTIRIVVVTNWRLGGESPLQARQGELLAGRQVAKTPRLIS